MESKINKVKRDLRALKKNSHAIQKLIEIQGLHYTRIKALSKLEQSDTVKKAIEKEKSILSSLGLEKQMAENQELEEMYMEAISHLSPQDKAIILDSYINGHQHWKIGLDYGFSESGARKHIDAIIKQIAKSI